MMIPHTKTYYKGKCPSCRSIIEFHSIHFTIDNDKGEMVSTCNNCEAMFRIVTRNPDESYISYGARKNSSIDYEIESASAYPDISDVVQFEGSLNDTKMIFDPNSKPLYLCSSCGEGLEKKAFSKLEETFSKIIQAYHDYTTVDIKSIRPSSTKNMIIMVSILLILTLAVSSAPSLLIKLSMEQCQKMTVWSC